MSWDEIFLKTEQLLTNWDPDPDHALHVRYLALLLYHQLAELHQLDSISTDGLPLINLLELAAMLHDVGWTAPGNRGHHKKSQDRILNIDIPGLNEDDKKLVALVARYHRKRHPDPMRHFMFAELDYDYQDHVRWMAGILRIADGLDRSHTTDVDDLLCEIQTADILLKIHSNTGSEMAISGANRKKGLLEEISNRSVSIEKFHPLR